MAQRDELDVEYPALILPDSPDAHGVAPREVAIESGLGPVGLVKDLDGRVRGGGTAEALGVGDVGPQGIADGVGGRGGAGREAEGDAGGVAVEDGDAVAGSGDAEGGLVAEGGRGVRVVEGAEDLPGLGLQLVLLARDKRDNVVENVHAAHARVAGARDGL